MIPVEQLFPIGTVVLLKGGKKKLMIYGRYQKAIANEGNFDYVGCLYPEGFINQETVFVFNQDSIQEVIHLGYRSEEEEELKKAIKIQN